MESKNPGSSTQMTEDRIPAVAKVLSKDIIPPFGIISLPLNYMLYYHFNYLFFYILFELYTESKETHKNSHAPLRHLSKRCTEKGWHRNHMKCSRN